MHGALYTLIPIETPGGKKYPIGSTLSFVTNSIVSLYVKEFSRLLKSTTSAYPDKT